ncbi:aldo/keto reductase [Microbacterium resistens]|uniref:Aldo/keto reductase n=1 Tax=Microbacterium resistens TaxID=156977 RepID=A0ABY3RXE1_9MICO|nr:aldo/keto reductase [Microbacterium resistens]UGS27371.1 aldo/keto reductase [Microbacterium resistens]
MRTRTIGGGDRATPVSAIALGAMMFGTATDEETSFAILDRFLASGGTFIDTSNNYATGSTAPAAARASVCSGAG